MSDGGKGSKPRPYSVSDQEYAARWDAIFGRDEKAKREDALNKMVSINQELGLYDDVYEFDDKPTRNNQETQDAQNFKVDSSGKSLL